MKRPRGKSDDAAALKHSQGATVVHHSPFADLDVPTLPFDAVKHLYPEFVLPFYLKRLSAFGAGADAAFLKIRGRITGDLVTELLSDFNWRSRTAAAYFAVILNLPDHIDHLGRLLLRSDVCYAGRAYCLAMAHFRTAAAIDFLNRYLAYYLTHPELFFDQSVALAALRFVDQKEGTSHESQHAAAIGKLSGANPSIIGHVSVDLITQELAAADRLRNL